MTEPTAPTTDQPWMPEHAHEVAHQHVWVKRQNVLADGTELPPFEVCDGDANHVRPA